MVVVQEVPISRLIERKVRSGFVMAWRLATSPTRISPVLLKATTEGVVRWPSALGMTTGSPPSRTETTELVVPRSIPTAFGMAHPFLSALSRLSALSTTFFFGAAKLWGGLPVRLGIGPAPATLCLRVEPECHTVNFYDATLLYRPLAARLLSGTIVIIGKRSSRRGA